MLKLSEKPIVNLSFFHFIQVLKPLDVKTKFYNAEVRAVCIWVCFGVLGLLLC